MLRKQCNCGTKTKGVKPIPRFPKVEKKKIDEENTEKKKINRYKWIMTRMHEVETTPIKRRIAYLPGFLPETIRLK
tara:strand:+ start:228 stop:455 length:228 start_codon:yes stop_codon:yes gene_type:complete